MHSRLCVRIRPLYYIRYSKATIGVGRRAGRLIASLFGKRFQKDHRRKVGAIRAPITDVGKLGGERLARMCAKTMPGSGRGSVQDSVFHKRIREKKRLKRQVRD